MEGIQLTIRADAGPAIGYGHFSRCMTLLHALRKCTPLNSTWLVRPDCDTVPLKESGEEWRVIEGEGWIDSLTAGRAPLLLDSYKTTVEQLQRLSDRGVHVTLMEDGCRLPHYPVDLLIDSAPQAAQLPYRGEIHTRFALGTSYLPLRNEFAELLERQITPDPARHLLVTFGGSDPEDYTARFLPILERLDELERVTVVLGPGYRGRASATEVGERVVLARSVHNMAELMRNADLALATAGGTALELASQGVPALLLPVTRDQQPIAEALMEAGAAQILREVSESALLSSLHDLIADHHLRATMSLTGQQLIDGKGAERAANLILESWRRAWHS